MMKKNTDESLRCSFCDASQNEVKKLIAGKSVFICDKCVGVCQEIIDEIRTTMSLPAVFTSPSRSKSNHFLDQYVVGQERSKKKLAVAVTTITSGSKCPARSPTSNCKNPTSC
jgi:ATP-dependent Clp protease ATP-binding subunit ClpX